MQHNLFILRILTEGMESLPISPPGFTHKEFQHEYMKDIDMYLSVPNDAQTIGDLFNEDVRAELVRRNSLDGVDHDAVDLQEKEQFFDAVRTRIAEMNIQVAEFPPVDLAYICTGITGPGLPFSRLVSQFDLISPVSSRGIQKMVGDVIVPIRYKDIRPDDPEVGNELTFVWEDWEIAVAVKMGGNGPGESGGGYVLYCRNEGNKQWKWRYGSHDDDWRTELYDSVEGSLAFYAHVREDTEEWASRQRGNISETP